MADPLTAPVLRAAEASTVKVKGTACGRYQEGSGWTVAPNLVVTNAHVVAGGTSGADFGAAARWGHQAGRRRALQP